MDDRLSFALSDSISEESQSVAAELIEAGLDSVMDNGLLKEVPILSVAVSLYKIGHSVKERHYIKKLAAFIDALNKGIVNEEKRKHYKSKVTENPKQRNKELEYILVLIDRYVHSEKAEILAKFYLAYLDGNIDWTTFTKASEVLDRLLPGDLYELQNGAWRVISNEWMSDSLTRLISFGLVIADENRKPWQNADSSKKYVLTGFGRELLLCLQKY